MKKQLVYMMICCLTILTSAMTCDWDDDWEANSDTQAGKKAYDYVKESLNKHTDVLALVYYFNKYVRQETTEGRDSIDRLYFEHVKIVKEKDIYSGKQRYVMRNFPMDGQTAEYLICIDVDEAQQSLTQAGTQWNVTATVNEKRSSRNTLADTLLCNYQITATADNQWTVKASGTPKCMFYFREADKALSSEELGNYAESFISIDNDFSIDIDEQLSSDKSLSWTTFNIKGTGDMESVAEPKMRMHYQTEKPLSMFYVDHNYTVQPHPAFFGLVTWKEVNYHFLTFWNEGCVNITVEDSLEGTSDEVKAWMSNQQVNVEYMGETNTWKYW